MTGTTIRRRWSLAASVVAVLALVGLIMAPPASAHTNLLAGSPGPAQRAGGTIESIDLVFPEQVTEFTAWLEGPDGATLPGSVNADAGQLFRLTLDGPLSDFGRYIVRYEMISADGDDTESAYFFNFEEGAPQPLPLGEVDVPQTGGTSALTIVSGAVLLACLVGLALLFVVNLERKRAATRTEEVSVS